MHLSIYKFAFEFSGAFQGEVILLDSIVSGVTEVGLAVSTPALKITKFQLEYYRQKHHV